MSGREFKMRTIKLIILSSAIFILGFVNNIFAQCGNYWSDQTSGASSNIRSVKAINNLVCWVGGNSGNVRRTVDGGITWTNANPPTSASIISIEAIDSNTAWCSAATTVFRTSNGGSTWSQVFTQTGGYINGIRFNNANTGFMAGDPVGGRWSLWKSTDAGVTWDSAGLYLPQAGTEAGWNNSLVMMGNNIWFGTNNTKVYRSTNAGATWSFGVTAGMLNSTGLHFNTPTLGLAGSTTGMMKTTDGGATYTSVTVLGSGSIHIAGYGSDFWYVRSFGVYRSTNSGDNWSLEYTSAGSLNHISFVLYNGCPTGWAGRNNAGGLVIKMKSDTLTATGNTNNQIPEAYRLEQNFPNPFNPTTRIQFQVSSFKFIKLVIFDVLGNEVVTLVNEDLRAGTYEADWSADKFSSGVYYYKLSAGDFTETKKMILLK